MKVFCIFIMAVGFLFAFCGLMLLGDSPTEGAAICGGIFICSGIISLAITQAFGTTPMNSFSVIFFSVIYMVTGFGLVLLGPALVTEHFRFRYDTSMNFGIFGSSLFGSGVISLAITRVFGVSPTKVFSIIILVMGFLLSILGQSIPELSRAYSGPGIALSIFSSTLFGSGVIALAITQAFGKKP